GGERLARVGGAGARARGLGGDGHARVGDVVPGGHAGPVLGGVVVRCRQGLLGGLIPAVAQSSRCAGSNVPPGLIAALKPVTVLATAGLSMPSAAARPVIEPAWAGGYMGGRNSRATLASQIE